MKIIIITQNDPFYLGKNLDYLFSKLPEHSEISACVVTEVSPFGKKEGFIKKALETYKIFGLKFFLKYSIKYILAKFDHSTKVSGVLNKHKIEEINLSSSINSDESLAVLRSYKPDLLISIAGNEIFRKPLIELAPLGCLNLHTALLPKYRGLMPSFWVLKNGEEETGVSVFYVDEGIDSGPIAIQKTIPINGMSQEQLISVTKKVGMDAILEAIEKIHSDEVSIIDNDDTKKSYYHFPTRKDVRDFLASGARFY